MKKYLIPIAAVVLLIVVGHFLMSSESTSNSTFPTLEIPDSAFPEGMSSADIVIKRVSQEVLFPDGNANEDMIGFSLEPDGTQFLEPITFSYSVPIEQDADLAVPQLFHLSDGQISIPDNTIITIDPDTNMAHISAEIEHFSTILVDAKGIFFLDHPFGRYPFPEKVVGKTFPYSVKIIPSKTSLYTGQKGFHITVAQDSTYTVSARAGSSLKAMHPDGIVIVPDEHKIPTKTMKGSETYIFDSTFFCLKKGTDQVSGSFNIAYTLQAEGISHYENGTYHGNGEFTKFDTVTKIQSGRAIKCKDRPAGEMVQLGRPYMKACPNGELKSFIYLYDEVADAPITNANGDYYDAATGKPVSLGCDN